MKGMERRGLGIVIFLCSALFSSAQDSIPPPAIKYIFFPYPVPNKAWHSSIGLTLTSMPQDITEEVQVRAPAGDFHVLRGLPKGFYLDGRLNFQIVQNHVSLGLRWARPISHKFSISLGDDFGFWYGRLNINSFDTQAMGWLNYPNVSVGFRADEDLLFTLKGEAFINLSSKSTVGGLTVSSHTNSFSGWGATLMLEQPFYGKKNISLGVRAMYSNFFWQTWSLYESFDRNIFYPEIVVGFIL
jgi:hypothetical protein